MIVFSDLAYSPRGVGPLSMTLEAGQVVLLCGPSGSGKSTLCSLLSGELEATSGRLDRGSGMMASMVSEVENQLLGSTIGQELQLGCPSAPAPREVPALARLRADLRKRWQGREGEDPQSLSTGEQQLLLLHSLALGPFELLILDEGLSCLDDSSFVEVCRVLRALAHEGGVLILLVSHELRCLPWVDRCAGLAEGRLVFDKAANDLTWDDLQRIRVWTGSLCPPADSRQLVLSSAPPIAISASDGLGQPQLEPGQPFLRYGESEVVLGKGEILAVAGVTGSGKSRLLMVAAGLDSMTGWHQDDSGYVVVLRQSASGMLWRRTVNAELEASLAEARRRHHGASVFLDDLCDIPQSWRERSPRSLSEGQAKFVACLCLLLQRPDLILLDEPFSGLDAHLRGQLERRLRQYLEAGGRAVFTTHRPDEMVLYAKRLLVLDGGAPVYHGDSWHYFQGPADPRLGPPGWTRRPDVE